MALKISVAIATYNEEKNIKRCLDSVRQLADEIVVVDGGSDDKTVKIASSIGRSRPEADRPMVEASGRKKPKVKVFVTDNPLIFHINKQKAIDKCNGDWILQLDADEEVTKELKEEILEKIKDNAFAGFFIPRKNFFLGRFLKKGGQYPDHTLRLYRKGKGRLPCRDVHEQAEVKGKIGYLKSDLIHWADPDFSRYLQRFNRYTDLLAKEIRNRKKKNYIFDFFQYIFIKPLHWFLSTFLRHKGFLDSWQGLIFSFFSALRFPVSYIKYLGIIGAAFSYTLAFSINGIFQLIKSKKLLNVKWAKFLPWHDFFIISIISIISLSLLFMVNLIGMPKIILIIVSGLVYFSVVSIFLMKFKYFSIPKFATIRKYLGLSYK